MLLSHLDIDDRSAHNEQAGDLDPAVLSRQMQRSDTFFVTKIDVFFSGGWGAK